jgi:hypothetical protein
VLTGPGGIRNKAVFRVSRLCRRNGSRAPIPPAPISTHDGACIRSTGNGSAPSCMPFQLGPMIVTPLPPHAAHRALRLRTSPLRHIG